VETLLVGISGRLLSLIHWKLDDDLNIRAPYTGNSSASKKRKRKNEKQLAAVAVKCQKITKVFLIPVVPP
jgi:hypothetical protein